MTHYTGDDIYFLSGHSLCDPYPFCLVFLFLPALAFYITFWTQAGRFLKFGLGCSSELLFRLWEGQLLGPLPAVVSKRVGFIFVIIMISTPSRYLCFVLISIELSESSL